MVLTKEQKAVKRAELARLIRKQTGIIEMTQQQKKQIRNKALKRVVGQRPNALDQISHTVIDGCVW